MRFKRLLITLIIISNLFITHVFAPSNYYYPRDGATMPNDVAYSTEALEFYADSNYIPLVDPFTGITAGLLFKNVTVPRNTNVLSANLSLYFDLQFPSPSPTITIYGWKMKIIQDFTIASIYDLINSPKTYNSKVWTLNTPSPGYYTKDITPLIQEIISSYFWDSGDSIGIIIQNAIDPIGGNRWATTNMLQTARLPRLGIRTGTPPGVIEPYRNGTLYNETLGTIGNISLTKLADFGSAFSDITIDSTPYQRRIIYSNHSQGWYVFYNSVNEGGTYYAFIDLFGNVVLQDQVFFDPGITTNYNCESFDVDIDNTGSRLYTVLTIDLDAGNNVKQSTVKETFEWRYYSVNANNKSLRLENTEILSDIALDPFDNNSFDSVQISVIKNNRGYQLIGFGTEQGNVYGDFLFGNNLRTSFNTSGWGVSVESINIAKNAWNAGNGFHHVLYGNVFNGTEYAIRLEAYDSARVYDWGIVSCIDIEYDIENSAYKDYEVANWFAQGSDIGASAKYSDNYWIGSTGSSSAIEDYNIFLSHYGWRNPVQRMSRIWEQGNANDYIEHAEDETGHNALYTLPFVYISEQGNQTFIYSGFESKKWFASTYNFTNAIHSTGEWLNNFTLGKLNTAITESKGNDDYASSLKFYGADGIDDLTSLIGALGVIDDTFSGGGNYTLYTFDTALPSFGGIIYIVNGTEISTPCLVLAYQNFLDGVYNYQEYLEAVKICIDEYYGYSDPLDPDPPGWDDVPGINKPDFIRYFLLFGLLLIFMPLTIFSYTRNWSNIPIYIFIMLIGVAFLIQILYV